MKAIHLIIALIAMGILFTACGGSKTEQLTLKVKKITDSHYAMEASGLTGDVTYQWYSSKVDHKVTKAGKNFLFRNDDAGERDTITCMAFRANGVIDTKTVIY